MVPMLKEEFFLTLDSCSASTKSGNPESLNKTDHARLIQKLRKESAENSEAHEKISEAKHILHAEQIHS